jgi:hypothetical protein
MDLSVHVQYLDHDKSGECDHDDVRERVMEHEEAHHENGCSLENRLP